MRIGARIHFFLLCILLLSASATHFSLRAFDIHATIAGSNTIESRQIGNGVLYESEYFTKTKWTIHTVIADLSNPTLTLRIGKGLDNISGLERVCSIAHRYDSLHSGESVLAAVNANFWRAGTNHPMGPTVIDGVVLSDKQHRNWSSLAIGNDDQIYISNYSMNAQIVTRFGAIPVDRFNYRSDSGAVVVYTSYFGSSIPFIDTVGIFLASSDTLTDDSEIQFDVASTIDSLRSLNIESGTLKIQFVYLKHPLANTITPCRITQIDTGIVSIPKNGGILSFGRGPFPLFFSLFVGDTFSLSTRLSPVVTSPVKYMASGTPRLVRNGNVSVEWREEGLTKQRFVLGAYGRTGIGISKDGKKIIFLSAEATNRRKGKRGLSLPDMAKLLVGKGAYQAINFDGGSSATLVVQNETVAPTSGTRFSRKISTALMLVTKEGVSQGQASRPTR